MHGDYGEVGCDFTGNTYNSVLTVQVGSAGMLMSWCLKTGELLLWSREGVHLNSANGVRRGIDPATSHHDPVLEFNSTGKSENEDDNMNMYSDLLHNYYLVWYCKLKPGFVVSVVVNSSSVLV